MEFLALKYSVVFQQICEKDDRKGYFVAYASLACSLAYHKSEGGSLKMAPQHSAFITSLIVRLCTYQTSDRQSFL